MRPGDLVRSTGSWIAFELDFQDSMYRYVANSSEVSPGEILLVLEKMSHPSGNFDNCNNDLVKILTSKGQTGWMFEDQTEKI